jgi:cytochrome c peroxidase
MRQFFRAGARLLVGIVLFAGSGTASAQNAEWQLPNEALLTPFKNQQPIYFLNRNQNTAEWDKLSAFWNEGTEKTIDPKTGEPVERKVVRIKVPLGLTANPTVPPENPMTVAKWKLGKDLYFDTILSSDGTVSCATCHDPARGFTDQAKVSTGIRKQKGGVSAPPILNAVFNRLQFWDGRAATLEDQAQGPVQNSLEMFDGKGHAWNLAVERVRKKSDYLSRCRQVFGTDPTRDGIAKAMATYERTVLIGNAIHDRAEMAMRKRVEAEETGKYEIKPADYQAVLQEAFARKDRNALTALLLDVDRDAGKIAQTAASIDNGRVLFFNKGRCNSCHAGDNFTDNEFHNLGVGVKNGEIVEGSAGRFGAQPAGAKNPEHFGAFKTPGLRGLLSTAPYMHDGSEDTLEKVIAFYNKGGNANPYLDVKMRDYNAEKAYHMSKSKGTPYTGPKVQFVGKNKTPIVPLELKLSPQEEKNLALFMRALQGDPMDPMIADRNR